MRCALALLLIACGARNQLHALDAGTTAIVPECETDDDCGDGVECTRDLCQDGTCASYTSDRACGMDTFCGGRWRCDARLGCLTDGPPCHDALTCTEDLCDEETRSCMFVPNTSFCPLSQRCDPIQDCVPRALTHDLENLYEIDLPSGDPHMLARLQVALADVALGHDGRLFGVGLGGLYEIDMTTGGGRHLDITGAQPGVALDVGPDGLLYSAGSQIDRIDPDRGTVEHYADLPPGGWEPSGDIAFVGDRLLISIVDNALPATENHLAMVPAGGGIATDLGSIGFGCVYGLAAFGDTLYGFTCEGKLLVIDPESGLARFIADLHGLALNGAAAR